MRSSGSGMVGLAHGVARWGVVQLLAGPMHSLGRQARRRRFAISTVCHAGTVTAFTVADLVRASALAALLPTARGGGLLPQPSACGRFRPVSAFWGGPFGFGNSGQHGPCNVNRQRR